MLIVPQLNAPVLMEELSPVRLANSAAFWRQDSGSTHPWHLRARRESRAPVCRRRWPSEQRPWPLGLCVLVCMWEEGWRGGARPPGPAPGAAISGPPAVLSEPRVSGGARRAGAAVLQ